MTTKPKPHLQAIWLTASAAAALLQVFCHHIVRTDSSIFKEPARANSPSFPRIHKNLLSPKGEGRVVVLMESVSYLEHCEKMKASCAKYSIPCELRVSSAYTGPGETLDIKSQYEGDGTPTVFITVSGRSNGLASILSANTSYPVINCPAVTGDWSAQDVWSTLNVPENFGFCTVVSPEAAAQFSAHILGLTNPQLWSKLRSCTLNKWISVKQADEKLRHCSM